MEFSDQDLEHLKDIYDFFQRNGAVKKKEIIQIFMRLSNKQLEEADSEDEITFEWFKEVIQRHIDLLDIVKLTTPSVLLEHRKDEPQEFDTKVIDFLRLLEEYRKKCI